MTRMIDPKDLEEVIVKHTSKLLYFDMGDALDDLVALVPATPKQGEVWLVETPFDGELPLIYGGNSYFPWIGLNEANPVEADRYTSACEPVSRIYPPAEATAPTTLSTEDDYRKAPAQTVVKGVSEGATLTYEKLRSGKWRVTGSSYTFTDEHMAIVARTVIHSPEEKTAN